MNYDYDHPDGFPGTDEESHYIINPVNITSDLSLNGLAIRHGTDKASGFGGHEGHNYTPLYERYFSHLRNEPIRLLEFGIGENPGGSSMRMWADYFPNAALHCLDYNPKSITIFDNDPRINANFCDQRSLPTLKKVVEGLVAGGQFDIIIDDASHENPDIIRTFEEFFPTLLRNGGTYVVEDIYHSYDRKDQKPTAIEYFKGLVDQVNNGIPGADNNPWDIQSVHFYRNIVFIFKNKDSVSK